MRSISFPLVLILSVLALTSAFSTPLNNQLLTRFRQPITSLRNTGWDSSYEAKNAAAKKGGDKSAFEIMSSSLDVEQKIDRYEERIVRHEAEIVRIKAHERYDMLDDKFIELIKSEKDGILACHTAIHDLRAQKQQSNDNTSRTSEVDFESSAASKNLALDALGVKFVEFNKEKKSLPYEPVDRKREMRVVLETAIENWTEYTRSNKYTISYAPQSQGSGKTFLVENLGLFVQKDMKSEGDTSIVKSLSLEYPLHAARIEAMGSTRSLVINFQHLCEGCKSLEQAIVLAIVTQLRGERCPQEFLLEVQKMDLSLQKLCGRLLAVNKAVIIVLDDIPALSSHDSYLQLFQNENISPAEKSRACMRLIKRVVEPLLPLPGLVLYMTGRAPDHMYQLLTTESFSPVLATAVLVDALKVEDIAEIIDLSPSTFEVFEVLRDELGLRNSSEVLELAQFLFLYTGGVARVVTKTLDLIRKGKYLVHRTADETIWNILASVGVNNKLYEDAKKLHGISPNWSLEMTSWDRALTTAALREIVESSHNNKAGAVDISTMFTVAKTVDERWGSDVEVSAVDLLSVLGVPYTIASYNQVGATHLELNQGLWMTRSLMKGKVVDWNAKKAEEIVMKLVQRVMRKDSKELELASMRAVVNSIVAEFFKSIIASKTIAP